MDEVDMKPSSGPPRAGQTTSPVDNPWLVLACLFLAAGALGVPLIWVSRAFSRPVKILLTVLVTVYTALMLWILWIVVVACYRHVLATF